MSKEIKLVYDGDYAQSANAVFHFMENPEWLKEILRKRAVIPRYCKEDVRYLDIHSEDMHFQEVLVLQKCFCDIPLHKLTKDFQLEEVDKNSEMSGEKISPKRSTHLDLYGEYGIAFSKHWAEEKKLQPVHYLNGQSQFTRQFSEMIGKLLREDNVPDAYADEILNRLSFVKPLRGEMERMIPYERGSQTGEKDVTVHKNFHDEQEWRYVPEIESLSALNLDPIIANPYLKLNKFFVKKLNGNLSEERYRPLWLTYNYEDIRYIIVPDSNAQIDIINTICSIPDDKFNDHVDIQMQKYMLVSKIFVWDKFMEDC